MEKLSRADPILSRLGRFARLKLQSRYRVKQFEVYGFSGETGADHMRHLNNLALSWERLPR
jgi:hypothetical protein